ncbi:thioredoxin family protein [Patescibacteria group bacterium]|nr:thioredoxin family protein [Patescibacteria group bacterium]MBU1256234.1 thioredoxin family protein [Patescibacteria group bacterium]MBU1457457.1 thioredoxin family protein [Patescibacteria group bacterium]
MSENGKKAQVGIYAPLLVCLLLVAVFFVGRLSSQVETMSRPRVEDEVAEVVEDSAEVAEPTLASPGDLVRQFETFDEYDSEICREDGKPVVYLFSTTWCSHCVWIKDTFDDWASENVDGVVAYHWQVDTGDNTLTEEVETGMPEEHRAVYEKFNPAGSIPTFVFGCRYSRVGNGYEQEDDLDKEMESFDKVVGEII